MNIIDTFTNCVGTTEEEEMCIRNVQRPRRIAGMR